ncbi:MAG: Rhodanese-related sulfurtransferase [Acidobacteria bacterium OLB17]|nr:MAG: Rhodanese-related sulfurtransferase [Acidobacteria bacterium OLB17]MCZ2391588.1 rhodanese-like domain-containing protein [Acidobacteriota bacterium]
MIKHISVHAVNEMLDAGGECQVIDVREFSEFNSERIADAQLMPLSNFERHADEIDHSRPVYLMCRSGNRAKQAAEKLMRKGFTDVHVVDGGMAAWASADLPVIKGESKIWSLERQVRFAAGLIVLTGIGLGFLLTPYLFLLSGFVGAGLVFSAVTDTCGMGMVLARMPWNKGPVSCEQPSARQADLKRGG